MGHVVGTIKLVSPQVVIGPDSGQPPTSPNTWSFDLDPGPPPAGGIKFVLLHFLNLNLPANNRLEIDLGYDTDVLKRIDDVEFWSRPVNPTGFVNGKVKVRYITDGAAAGGVTLDRFGLGARNAGDSPSSNSNCDPFLLDANYTEPAFDPVLFCATPPDIENIDCVAAAGDVRTTVAPAVGMIVHADLSADGNTETLTTFTGTLVGPDLVLTTAQPFSLSGSQLSSSAIIFNYQTTCAGARPVNYAGRFLRVKRIVKLGFFGAVDYALLQIIVPPGGLGITPVIMRTDLPQAGEQIFSIHHPEGAVKRLSGKSPAFKTVISSGTNGVLVDLDVASGSLGAGLFDTSGKVVGLMSTGSACNISFFPTASVLTEIGNPLGDPFGRDVAIVFDRSGSMGSDAGTGRLKIEEARDAASLFVQLLQSGGGNKIALVSFSTTASNPVDFALATVDAASKNTLTGPAPFDTGLIGALTPGGSTSIGDGLEAARDQLPEFELRTILLLTDGLENTQPLIAGVTGLGGIDINAIGFGAGSSLNGDLLTQLSESHNGIYLRAGDGLDLKKYFALAFGNIFGDGTLLDPQGRLKAADTESKIIKFNVCDEKAITIVAGWDSETAKLAIVVKTPGGVTINVSTHGVQGATGRTWSFLRIPLPHNGERNGTWSVTLKRVSGSLAVARAVDFFVNVIADGGAKLTRWPGRDFYFTGEAINPIVRLAGGASLPKSAKIDLTVRKPTASVGTILTKAKKAQPPSLIKDEVMPARYATIAAIEKSTRKPIVDYAETRFALTTDPAKTGLALRRASLHGVTLTDVLDVEGTYTFHAVVTYGGASAGRRELLWSVEVGHGIDQTKSGVKIKVGATRPDKRKIVTFQIVPRDSFGNYVGPGRPDAFTVTGAPGTTLIGAVRDNGDGSYTVGGLLDPGRKPAVTLGRAERCVCAPRSRPGVRSARKKET